MPDTATEPTTSMEVSPGTSPRSSATAHESMYAGDLVSDNVTTYGNGMALCSANFGDSNIAEGDIYQVDVEAAHPLSNTAWDKTTAYTAGYQIKVIKHIKNNRYWLHGSSLTVVKSSKIVITSSGRVKVALAHTASAKPVHMYTAPRAFSAASWIQGTYRGMVSYYTANS